MHWHWQKRATAAVLNRCSMARRHPVFDRSILARKFAEWARKSERVVGFLVSWTDVAVNNSLITFTRKISETRMDQASALPTQDKTLRLFINSDAGDVGSTPAD